jgi:hypothetical protein
MENGEMPLPARLVTYVGIAAAIVLSFWTTIIAFVGGTMPIIGWETDGGLVTGVVWLMFVDPILMTVCYWATMIVAVPLALLFNRETDRPIG